MEKAEGMTWEKIDDDAYLLKADESEAVIYWKEQP